MAILRLNEHDAPPADWRGGALTIGNFDGVHRGHAALVAELRRLADAVGGPAVALSFDPHPLQLLRPERFQPVLTTPRDRAELLQSVGADHVVLLQTTPELLRLSAAEFFERMVVRGLGSRAMAEGENFGFGRDREGDVRTLAELCGQASITFRVVPPLTVDGVPISSSRVRNALVKGAMREATGLLGRSYRLRGTVGTGQRRGQTIGFPTANLVAALKHWCPVTESMRCACITRVEPGRELRISVRTRPSANTPGRSRFI